MLLAFGTARVAAADPALVVSGARPGERVKLVVRREGGGFRQLTVVPAGVT